MTDLDKIVPAEKELPELYLAEYHENKGWNACRAKILALIDNNVRSSSEHNEPAPAIDLEQFRPAVYALSSAAATKEDEAEVDRLLSLIDGQANVRSSSEHSSGVTSDPVTDDAVRRLVRAMENTPGDELIEPNTRLCRRLLVAALQPTKGEGVSDG